MNSFKNYNYIIIVTILICFCSYKKNELTGQWSIKNKFYKATYEIVKEKGELNGKVIAYDDGTTKFDKSNRKDWYVFKKLEKRDNLYVDGYSGASSIRKKTITLEQVHHDTLEVKFFFSKEKFRMEKWLRKKTEL